MPFMVDGKLKLYYEIHGKGPRLLFITGTASDLRQTSNIFQSPLVKHFEVLSLDQRGIGQSNSPDTKPTMLTYAKDIKKLLHHIGWDHCYCVGESFGGMVAQEFALRYPTTVKKLVLVVTSSGGKGGSSFPYHKYNLAKMTLTARADFFVQCGDSRMSDPTWKKKNKKLYDAQYQTYLEVFQLSKDNPDKKLFSERQIHARQFHDTYARLPKLKMPVYLCAGRYDKTAPIKNQLALLKQIPQARLTFFNGSHGVLWQDDFAFESIMTFLQNTAS